MSPWVFVWRRRVDSVVRREDQIDSSQSEAGEGNKNYKRNYQDKPESR